jgi:hypothetical protein
LIEFDVLDVQYFAGTGLPLLAEVCILKRQVELLFEKIVTSDKDIYVD